MPERWFLFVQLEIPWELGPADGRYLLRGGAEREPQHVVVLRTVGAARRRERGLLGGRTGRGREVKPEPEPAAVPVTRATVIDPVPVSAQAQARAWLAELDGEREAWAAAVVLNRMLLAHRIAAADAYTYELSPAQALAVRAGWGVGEQVAEGQWEFARELRWEGSGSPPRRRRALALRPQERLTWLLGGRERALLCEELTLRARRDLDQGRLEHAAVELRSAYAAAVVELSAEDRPDLVRIAELRELSGTIAGAESPASPAVESKEPGEEIVRHALERLEAALRARSAGLKLA